MSEQASRDTFRKQVAKQLPEAHWQRFEDKFQAGIPDINICYQGVETWVEAKHIKALPKWPHTPIKVEIRKEQVIWLNNRKRAGGRVLVLVRIGREEWVAFNDHFKKLEEGIPMETFFQLATYRSKELDVKRVLEYY